MNTNEEAIIKEFREKIPPRGLHPSAGDFDQNGESKTYPFGFKRLVGDEIFTVTDWANIEDFILERESLAREEALDEMVGAVGVSHDLPSKVDCSSAIDHDPVWDGNYYTCSVCGVEFVRRTEILTRIEALRKKV